MWGHVSTTSQVGWTFCWCTGLAFLLSWQWIRPLLDWLTAVMSPSPLQMLGSWLHRTRLYLRLLVGQPHPRYFHRHTMSVLALPVVKQTAVDLSCTVLLT